LSVERFFFCFGGNSPHCARASLFTRLLDHIQRRTTVVRTPLDEWSARRRDLYLTTHTTLTAHKHPCPRWDSNPQSQQASGRRPTSSNSRSLGPASSVETSDITKGGNFFARCFLSDSYHGNDENNKCTRSVFQGLRMGPWSIICPDYAISYADFSITDSYFTVTWCQMFILRQIEVQRANEWSCRLVTHFVQRIVIASGCLMVTSADLHLPWWRLQQQRRCTIALLTYFTTVCEFPIPRHFYNWRLRQDTLRMSGEIWGDVDRDGERAEPMFQIRKQALLIIFKCVIS
jgi:hypothetical protein